MFIQTEETPNPQSLKFIPDGAVVAPSESFEFKNKELAAKKSPLAQEIFSIEGVHSVFLGRDFVTVTKSPEIDWAAIKTDIMACIVDFFVAGKQPLKSDATQDEVASSEEDSEVVKQIKELLEIKVKPAVAMDGGDVIYRGFEDGIVMLELKGACSGCPSSTITLKNGIESMFKHYIPEVVAVEQFFGEE